MTTNWKKRYFALLEKAQKGGLHIHTVSNLEDYAGINTKAGRLFGMKMEDDTIEIAKGLNYEQKYHTLAHEIHELDDMNHHMSYWRAHKRALREE